MKTFFKKNLIAVFALLVGIGTMSFKMTDPTPVYHYTSNSTDEWEFAEPGNWSPGAGNEDCGEDGDKPCTITTDDLEATLSGKTNQEVLDISTRRY